MVRWESRILQQNATMPLTIHLDNPLPSYSGGETIRGRVTLESLTQIEVKDIRITLSGKAKTKIKKVKHVGAPRTTYRGKAVLFEKEKILVHIDGTLPPQTLEWRFEFTFPTHVQARSGKSQWSSQIPFDAESTTHSLPPTFMANVENELWEIESVVAYQIQVDVSKTQRMLVGRKSLIFHEVIPLTFIPPVPFEEEKGYASASRMETFTIRSLLLLPENRGRKLDIREKMTSWLSPSQLPVFKFRVIFNYSSCLHQSDPMVCTLDIQPMLEDSTVASVAPTVFLKSVSLTLLTRTVAWSSPSIIGSLVGDVEESKNILSEGSLRIPATGQIDISGACGQISLQHPDPSFSTFNICRSYRLHASIVLECAEKTVTFSVSDADIHILPDKRSVDASEAGKTKGHPYSAGRVEAPMEPVPELDSDGVSPPAYDYSSSVSVASCEKGSL
ncbi:hypothetical protein C8Q69DRAFT_475918 [Paecilomyces variotii]|uniref:Arrestin-like N-terminal domain-containing protein n=1 Tax=Byssochlamys spectabilis TaxID=264951 RepID=A0A443HNC5_BYSSP|nr:hypothetical protein C8Q69DRAFT_475918 [Paecilomyces variotii]RWQ93317.1 hypothetical protein C8Q69DRAFT_475918 [Paecilomyces variotii]